MAAGVHDAARVANLQYSVGLAGRGHGAMVARSVQWQGLEHLDLRFRGDWGRHVRARLSVFPHYPEGGSGDSDLWYQAEFMGACTPGLHDDGPGAEESERRVLQHADAGDGGGLRADMTALGPTVRDAA